MIKLNVDFFNKTYNLVSKNKLLSLMKNKIDNFAKNPGRNNSYSKIKFSKNFSLNKVLKINRIKILIQ
jgi:hypothetical protein